MSAQSLFIKFPTRGRRAQFTLRMRQYLENLSGNYPVHFQLTLDADDKEMPQAEITDVLRELCKPYTGLVTCNAIWDMSTGKVNAVNRDMDVVMARAWSVLLLASDDMMPEAKGYDRVIMQDMQQHFPDTDGVLWYNDGFTEQRLNTLVIAGRAYIERFGYIYNPAYKSLFCDNEFMDVANMLRRQVYSPRTIIRHMHPANGCDVEKDALYAQNDVHHRTDSAIYRARKAAGFGLK